MKAKAFDGDQRKRKRGRLCVAIIAFPLWRLYGVLRKEERMAEHLIYG